MGAPIGRPLPRGVGDDSDLTINPTNVYYNIFVLALRMTNQAGKLADAGLQPVLADPPLSERLGKRGEKS